MIENFRRTARRVRQQCTSVSILIVLVACTNESRKAASSATTPPTNPTASATTMTPVVTMKQLMEEVFDPAADRYWEAVGSTSDKNGTVDHAPKSDEQWATVRNQATILAESANLLMMDGRAVNRDEWITLSKGMITAATHAREAAIAHDRTRVFDTGAELYDACVNCHAKYMVQKYPMPDVRPAK